MKTFLAFVGACLFWSSAANAQSLTDREQAGLLGPVKSVELYSIEFVMKDGKTEEARREPRYSYTYNIEGNKVEDLFHNRDKLDKHLYTYDAKGRRNGYEAYELRPDNTSVFQGRGLYTLDDNGNTIEHKNFNSDGDLIDLITYKYDSRGNKIEESKLTSEGMLRRRFVAAYDEKGNQISHTSFGADDSIERKTESVFDNRGNAIEDLLYLYNKLIYKAISRYDEKKRLLEQEITDVSGIPEFRQFGHEFALLDPGKVIYTYDDKKRTKEVTSYEPDGSLKERSIYTYDEKGNEIGKAKFKADGSPDNPAISFYESADKQERKVIDSVTGESMVEIEYDLRGNWTRKTFLVKSGKDDERLRYYAEEQIITYH